MSIRKRLFLLIVLLLTSSIVLVGALLKGELRDQFAFLIEDSMVELSQMLASSVVVKQDNTLDVSGLENSFHIYKEKNIDIKILDSYKSDLPLDYYLTNKDGIVVSSSRKDDITKDYSRWNDVYLTLRGKYGARASRTNPKDPSSSVYYVGAPVINSQGEIVGSLSVIKNHPGIMNILEDMLDKLILIGITVTIILMILGISLTSWITKPLKQVRFFIQQLSQGKRVPAPNIYLKEFEQLSKQVDGLRVSLEGKNKIEEYIQGLTHELKSPLTAILGAAELSLEEMPKERREKFLNNIIHEVKKGRTLLDKMLEVAKLENTPSLNIKENINISELMDKVVFSLMPIAEKESIQIKKDIPAEFTIKGDPFLIEQAIRNILQNALEFSRENSSIFISIEKDTLIIRDEGVGIPEYAIKKIFNKFYTLDRPEKSGKKGEKGTGLGLSFVKEVIDLHHGSISIESDNSGTIVYLKFSARK